MLTRCKATIRGFIAKGSCALAARRWPVDLRQERLGGIAETKAPSRELHAAPRTIKVSNCLHKDISHTQGQLSRLCPGQLLSTPPPHTRMASLSATSRNGVARGAHSAQRPAPATLPRSRMSLVARASAAEPARRDVLKAVAGGMAAVSLGAFAPAPVSAGELKAQRKSTKIGGMLVL